LVSLQILLWLAAPTIALCGVAAVWSGGNVPTVVCASLFLLAGTGIASLLLFVRHDSRRLRRIVYRQVFLKARQSRTKAAVEKYIAELRATNEQLKDKNAQIELHGQEVFKLFRAASEQAQLLTRAKEAAEVASRAKSELLANMSHELRTPMTAILGFSEVLMDSLCEPGQTEIVATIQRNGEYLLRLINDLLDLSQIEDGKIQLESTGCSPAEVVDEVAALMQVRARAKGVMLHHECEGEIPDTIDTDPTRLRQILINLVGNAIKFTEVGSVCVTTKLNAPEDQKPMLEFRVIDTGIGMTRDQMAKLFQPFTQANASTTRKYGGSGLGLAISKRLAKMLGGDITVSSVSGAGSTFVLSIPAGSLEGRDMIGPHRGSAEQRRHQLPSRSAQRLSHPYRILMAEDGPDNQRLISFILEKAGADVTVVGNGQLAVEQALEAQSERPPYDLILMDMQMPVMDGYAATERLRQAGYDGPIVALTAYAMKGDSGRCLKVGCDGYLAKPIRREALVEVVERWAMKPHSGTIARSVEEKLIDTSQSPA